MTNDQFSHWVVSNSLWLQHARLPRPSPTLRACSNPCPSSQWCHSAISFSVVPFLLSSIFSRIRVFSNESALGITWPKYWSFRFSISLSNKYLGLISFRIGWFDLLRVQGTLKRIILLWFKFLFKYFFYLKFYLIISKVVSFQMFIGHVCLFICKLCVHNHYQILFFFIQCYVGTPYIS